MAKRVGLFVDVSNLYYSIGAKYNKRKIDYVKYYSYVSDYGKIVFARAYGAQLNKQANSFIHCLEQIGFDTKFIQPKVYHNESGIRRKADLDVVIALDIVKELDGLDIVILGSADGDLSEAVRTVKDAGKQVLVLACNISASLRDLTDCVEIPESFLEEERDEAIKIG